MSESTVLNDGWRYAEVEIMGHRSHLGRAREVDLLGARYLEVEDLTSSRVAHVTSYPERSIFSVAWLSEEEGKRRVEEMQEENGTAPEEQKRVRVRAVIDLAVQRAAQPKDTIWLCVFAALTWCDPPLFKSVFDGMLSSGDLEEYPGKDGGEARYGAGIPF
jgi:hypothetical protein